MKFRFWKDTSGQWRWRLRGGNNEIIASGETYKNKADCLHAIDLVKSAWDAPVTEAQAA